MIHLTTIGFETDFLRIKKFRAKGAIVLTNFKTNQKEVKAFTEQVGKIAETIYGKVNVVEYSGKYYFITPINKIEISETEFNQIKKQLTNN